jgi:hypothetical protein
MRQKGRPKSLSLSPFFGETLTPQTIEIQPFRFGWQVRGTTAGPTPPFFTGSSAFEHAIAYAQERTRAGVGEIRILARTGEVIMRMPFGTQKRYVSMGS